MIRQQMLIGQTSSFQAFIYEDNQKVVPSSATITIYKPGGSTVLVNAQAMTVSADGLLSYNLTTANNDTVNENYKAVISYTVTGTVYTLTLFYDVIRSKLVKVITDEDIVVELPQLRKNGWRYNGVAESGSSTTIVDLDLTQFEDDHWTGGLAYSATLDETRKVTDFVSSTGTVTTEAFGTAISTDKYTLTRSYTKEINRAFEALEGKLKRMGRRAHLILDPYDLREVHIAMSVAEVAKGLTLEEEGFWWNMWQEYEKKSKEIFNGLSFKYDTSEDGYLAGSEEAERFRTLRSGRG